MTTTLSSPGADLPQPRNQPILPAAGRTPTATPPATAVGVLLALGILAAGVIALRDTAITLGWLHGPRWINTAIDSLDGLRFHWPMLAIGVIAIAAGIWMITAALRPRPKTAIALKGPASIWMSPQDVARLATHTATTVPGVIAAHATATRRKITITAQVTDPTADHTTSHITAAITAANTVFLSPPRITIHLKKGTPG